MAEKSAREFLVKKNGTTIASVRTKSVTWNGSPIDITTDDDDGVMTYLADKFANTSLEMQVDGLTNDDVLSDLAFSTDDSDRHLSDLTMVLASGDTISGTFIMTSYNESGSYEDAIQFSATLVRSGIHTLTPAA